VFRFVIRLLGMVITLFLVAAGAANAEIKSCEDVSLGNMKEVLFDEIERSLIGVGFLFPTRFEEKPAFVTTKKEDLFLKSKFDEF